MLTGELEYRQYLRMEMMPHILCPGCGHGIVLKAILRAIHRLQLPRERVVFVSGIGCSSRLVGYVDFPSLHTTHGRPLTFATGLKLARPDLHVIVITGDGDGLAIGGNHLIHAARRNVGVTCLLLNNSVYGMTGGQGAPTTPAGSRSSTMPGGTVEPSFDACRLVAAAGGSFVARGMTTLPLELEDLVARAIEHGGFSFLEILSDCPEYFGRYNELGRGPEMLEAQRRQAEWVDTPLAEKRFLPGLDTPKPASRQRGLASGVFVDESRPELSAELHGRAPVKRHPHAAVRDGGEARERRSETSAAEAAGGPAEYRVRFAGAGGQGVVLAGLLLAEAAVSAGKNATHAQAYGPESRGGASKADVIISDGEIDYPYSDRVDVLLALTQEAYEKYAALVTPGGTILVDADRVSVDRDRSSVHALPIVATAERVLGTSLGANLVALGALITLSRAVPPESVERTIGHRRPGGRPEQALIAFRAGINLARAAVSG